MEKVHPVFAALEAENPQGITDFLSAVGRHVAAYLRQGIDTAEERRGVEQAILAFYDKYVSVRVPAAMQPAFRKAVSEMVEATLMALAG